MEILIEKKRKELRRQNRRVDNPHKELAAAVIRLAIREAGEDIDRSGFRRSYKFENEAVVSGRAFLADAAELIAWVTGVDEERITDAIGEVPVADMAINGYAQKRMWL